MRVDADNRCQSLPTPMKNDSLTKVLTTYIHIYYGLYVVFNGLVDFKYLLIFFQYVCVPNI